jgi:hypothetical protein
MGLATGSYQVTVVRLACPVMVAARADRSFAGHQASGGEGSGSAATITDEIITVGGTTWAQIPWIVASRVHAPSSTCGVACR